MIKRIVLIVFLGLLYNPFCIVAQDSIPKIKEITEENTIKFQEYFFKSLSEKSIKNYQIAIQNLEECNAIFPNNKTVLFELSKNYFLLNRTTEALQYINNALRLDPSNFWMLKHLVTILKKDKNYKEAIKTQLTIVKQNPKQRTELVRLYYFNRQYTDALSLINTLEQENGLSINLKQLKNSLELRKNFIVKKEVTEDLSSLIANYEKNQATFENLKKLLDFAIKSDVQTFHKYSKLGIDLFPAQPFSYLSKGKALQLQGKYQEAVDILEIGIDFIVENSSLEVQFYTILVKSYGSLNNTRKALEYKKKLKNVKI
jgi:tetratricopeptide (TPR) repeat protein